MYFDGAVMYPVCCNIVLGDAMSYCSCSNIVPDAGISYWVMLYRTAHAITSNRMLLYCYSRCFATALYLSIVRHW